MNSIVAWKVGNRGCISEFFRAIGMFVLDCNIWRSGFCILCMSFKLKGWVCCCTYVSEHSLLWCNVCIVPFFLSHIFMMLVSDPLWLICKFSLCRLDLVPVFKSTHAHPLEVWFISSLRREIIRFRRIGCVWNLILWS